MKLYEEQERQRPSDYFADWKEREALAEGMIPLVGKLYRKNNVKTYIYGHPLVNRSVIEIMQDHRAVRQIETSELSEFETFPILRALAAHDLGHAHSVEAWYDDELVGGLYGVSLGRAFFGESMFSRQTDASKIALTYLVARLKYASFALLDCQFATDHLARFGLKEIPRATYHATLQTALAQNADFHLMPGNLSPVEVLHAVGHKS